MSVPRFALVATALVLGLAGCGSDDASDSADRPDGERLRVALVTDIGGLNDRGFNALAYRGLQSAETELGVTGRVFISESAADYVPNLSTAAQRGFDLVIAVGFLMAESTSSVAEQFPDTRFAIVDVSAPSLDGSPANVRGIVFAEQEAGCLAGVAAATVSESGIVGSVGGLKIPPVDAFIAGYRHCARAVDPSLKLVSGYSQDFVAQDKCKELALSQIGRDADVVFQVAGGCGLGAIQAAKDRDIWGIGVDNDQGFLGPHVLTSAVKRVDVGVETTIRQVVEESFAGGADGVFDVGNEGVGYGEVSSRAPIATRSSRSSTAGASASPPARSYRRGRSPDEPRMHGHGIERHRRCQPRESALSELRKPDRECVSRSSHRCTTV
jgi:basic membrane protein A and related proteins